MTCILQLGKHQEPLPMFGLNLCELCPTFTSTCHHGHRRESPRLYMPSFAPLCSSPVLKSPANVDKTVNQHARTDKKLKTRDDPLK